MIEIGNGVFTAEISDHALAMSRTHMTYWCIMKAVMLLGNDFTAMSKATLGVVANLDAISVNQVLPPGPQINIPAWVFYMSWFNLTMSSGRAH